MSDDPHGDEPTKIVGIDDYGNRVGEDHPRATISDEQVEAMRQAHEDGVGVREIARRFGVSLGCASMIVNFKRRAVTPMGWKRVRLTPGAARIVSRHVRPSNTN